MQIISLVVVCANSFEFFYSLSLLYNSNNKKHENIKYINSYK